MKYFKSTKFRVILEIVISISVIVSICLPITLKNIEEVHIKTSHISGVLGRGNYELVNSLDGSPGVIDGSVYVPKDTKLIISKETTVTGIFPSTLSNSTTHHEFVHDLGGEISWEGKFELSYVGLQEPDIRNLGQVTITLSNPLSSDSKQFIDVEIFADHYFKDYCGNCIDIKGSLNENTVNLELEEPHCDKEYFTFREIKGINNRVLLENGLCMKNYLKDMRLVHIDEHGFEEEITFDMRIPGNDNDLVIVSPQFHMTSYTEAKYGIYYKEDVIYHSYRDKSEFIFDVTDIILIDNQLEKIIETDKYLFPYSIRDNHIVDICVNFEDNLQETKLLMNDMEFEMTWNGELLDIDIDDVFIRSQITNPDMNTEHHIEFMCNYQGIDCGYFQRKIIFIKGVNLELEYNKDFILDVILEHNIDDFTQEFHYTSFIISDGVEKHRLYPFSKEISETEYQICLYLPNMMNNNKELEVYLKNDLIGKRNLETEDLECEIYDPRFMLKRSVDEKRYLIRYNDPIYPIETINVYIIFNGSTSECLSLKDKIIEYLLVPSDTTIITITDTDDNILSKYYTIK